MRLEENTQTFFLKEEHIKLLRAMYFDFDDSMYDGAPSGDQKRPYGNKDIYPDMIKILGLPVEKDRHDEVIITKERHEELVKLHRETGTALQIIMLTGSFTPGLYEKTGYGSRSWVKVENLY